MQCEETNGQLLCNFRWKGDCGQCFFLLIFCFFISFERKECILFMEKDGRNKTVDSRSSLFRIFVPCLVLVERSSLTKQVGTYFKRRVVEKRRFS